MTLKRYYDDFYTFFMSGVLRLMYTGWGGVKEYFSAIFSAESAPKFHL